MTIVNPEYDTDPNPPFLGLYTEEDMGLKSLLQGVTVTDINSSPTTPRPVPVWFMNPEREERRVTYPNITINFMSERVAHEREHRGWVPVGYRYLQNIPWPDWVFMEYPIPMDFDYSVTVSTRINQHISQICGTLALGRLHPRFAQMTCPGGTVRRITIMGVTRTNSMEADKRLFRQIYQVRISTEVEAMLPIATTRVAKVVLDLVERRSGITVWGKRAVSAIGDTPQVLPGEIHGQYQSETAGA